MQLQKTEEKKEKERKWKWKQIAWEEKEPGSCCTGGTGVPFRSPAEHTCLECLIFTFSFPSTSLTRNLLPAFPAVSHPKMLTHEGALPSFPSLSRKSQGAGASFHKALNSPSVFSCFYFLEVVWTGLELITILLSEQLRLQVHTSMPGLSSSFLLKNFRKVFIWSGNLSFLVKDLTFHRVTLQRKDKDVYCFAHQKWVY